MIKYNPHVKRLLDFSFALLALGVLSPFLALVSILIVIDSKGKPFFRQVRIGKDLSPFLLVKFRTMVERRNPGLGDFEPGDKSRVTRLGKILRKTKVDELPELFNVLKGEMSIVGPRPEVKRYVEAFADHFSEVLTVKPGLSDLASITYRNEEEILAGQNDPEEYYLSVILPAKLRMAKLYIENVSLKTDLRIIFLTLKSLFSRL